MILFVLLYCTLFRRICSISEHPILIIVSYDGFRYNYFEKNATPFLAKLREKGTFTDFLINVFPTKTFPNHHSIATGLFADIHGVVGNSFYDPLLKEIINIQSPDMYNYNKNVTPIWTLNELADSSRYSGSMMWPGGHHFYQNKSITYKQPWDPNYDFYKRIDTVISWILNPSKPANLIMLYIEEPDVHSHFNGPDSDKVFQILKHLDNVTQYFHDQIKATGLENDVNVIHLSDHGMLSVPIQNTINITKFLRPDTYEIADTSPCLHILPGSDMLEDIYNRLSNASKKLGHFTVYKKENMPERWHFKNNRRTPPIFLLSDEGYAFQDVVESALLYNATITENQTFGVHGYENDILQMRPFFIALGPKIKRKHRVPPFHTVDLYNLFAELLNVKPQTNNGTLANIKDIVFGSTNGKNDNVNYMGFSIVGVVIVILIIGLMMISCGAVITLLMIRRQNNVIIATTLGRVFPHTSGGNFTSVIEAQHLLDAEE